MKALLILIILIPFALNAQQYTLDDLMNHGLANSLSSQQARLGNDSSQSQLNSARINLFPEATLSAGLDNQFYNPLPVSDLSSNIGFSISKSISLTDPSWYQYRQSRLDVQSSELSLQGSISNLVYQIFAAYIDVLSKEKQHKSISDNLKIQTRILDQSNVLKAQGRITDFDVKQNEIAVLNSEISLLKIQNDINKSRMKLFALVRLQDEGYELADLEYTTEFTVPELSLESLREIRILEQEIKKSELTLSQEKMNFLPKLTLSYNFSRRVGGEDFDFDTYNTTHGVSLTASYSLWNHFRQSETAKRAKISKQMNQLNLIDKSEEIAQEYETLKRELEYLLQLNDLYQQKYEQAQVQLRTAEERYRFGMIAQLELDQTRAELLEADIAKNANTYQVLLSREAINLLLSNKILGKW